ncbi:MAG: hypothetical protein IKM83_00250 [Paludibacteraceae bacterium]|nr:hypothetical protein [Paludibacteraceae bacterium]
MPRILVICNTPFQFVVIAHILSLYYKEYEVDIVISNQFRDSWRVVENAKKSRLFRKVYYIKNVSHKRGNSLSRRLDYYKRIFVSCWYAFRIGRTYYDDILFSNIQIFTKVLISVARKKNKGCRIHIAEEGLGTYSKFYGDSDSIETPYRKYIDREGVFAKLSTLYLFNPQFLTWDFPKNKICKLPVLDACNSTYMNMLNILFDYKHCKDHYDKKYIFFEESYYAEGEEVPDVEIVNRIAEKVGKENIMVKVHPRNPINRFKQLGYKTNDDSFIPWELIVLNQDMRDKVFITIASGAVINPFLYMGLPLTSYSLLNCLEHRPGIMSTSVGDIMAKAYASYPDILIAPKTIDDFLSKIA